MIIANNMSIDSTSTSIEVFVAAPVGEVFTSAKLWDSNSYKSSTDFIDLTSLLGGTQLEIFTVPVSMIEDTAFNGVYYIEATTDLGTTRVIAASNLTIYHKCILDKLLKVELVDCVAVQKADCDELKPSDVNTINTFLEGLYYALEMEDFLAAQKVELCIVKMCSECGCATTTNTDNLSGTNMTSDVVIKY